MMKTKKDPHESLPNSTNSDVITIEQEPAKSKTFEEKLMEMSIAQTQEVLHKTLQKLDEAAYHWRLAIEETVEYPMTLETPDVLADRICVITQSMKQKIVDYKAYTK